MCRRSAIVALACLLLTACNPWGVLDSISRQVRPGLLYRASGARAYLVIPDTVQAGLAFDVRIDTFAGTCATDGRRTDVVHSAPDLIVISPYDVSSLAHCRNDVESYATHKVSVSFARPGPAIIRIVGDSAVHGSDDSRVSASIILPIIVH